jgi:hypothetical protein
MFRIFEFEDEWWILFTLFYLGVFVLAVCYAFILSSLFFKIPLGIVALYFFFRFFVLTARNT